MKKIILYIINFIVIGFSGFVILAHVVYKKISKVKTNYLREYEAFEDTEKKDMYIISRDNFRLHGTLIKSKEESKLCVIIIHGIGERSIIQAEKIASFYHERNVHVLLTDQRGYGLSKGEYTTYGSFESRDHMMWLDAVIEELGDDVKIAIHGMSMGAATALLMCRNVLPKNVKGIVADSSYTTAKDMLKKTFERKHLNKDVFYYLYKKGCFFRNSYDPERTKPIDGISNLNLPVIVAHSKDDSIVPYEMALELYEACPSINKRLITVDGDNHSFCFELSEEMRDLVDTMINKLR